MSKHKLKISHYCVSNEKVIVVVMIAMFHLEMLFLIIQYFTKVISNSNYQTLNPAITPYQSRGSHV